MSKTIEINASDLKHIIFGLWKAGDFWMEQYLKESEGAPKDWNEERMNLWYETRTEYRDMHDQYSKKLATLRSNT